MPISLADIAIIGVAGFAGCVFWFRFHRAEVDRVRFPRLARYCDHGMRQFWLTVAATVGVSSSVYLLYRLARWIVWAG